MRALLGYCEVAAWLGWSVFWAAGSDTGFMRVFEPFNAGFCGFLPWARFAANCRLCCLHGVPGWLSGLGGM
jgi:hypothetical protein